MDNRQTLALHAESIRACVSLWEQPAHPLISAAPFPEAPLKPHPGVSVLAGLDSFLPSWSQSSCPW